MNSSSEFSSDYTDIIDLPHHVSAAHPHMPIQDRAAQFAPFAALTGHNTAIQETARLTAERVELTDDAKRELDEQLHDLSTLLPQLPTATFTYFQPDAAKDGGAYVTISGAVKKIDSYKNAVILTDGTILSIAEMIAVEL